MYELKEFAVIAVLIINFLLLSSSRLRACIRISAVQGLIVGLMPLMVGAWPPGFEAFAGAFAAVGIKCALLPWLLLRVVERTEIRREIEPLVSYAASILFGVLATAAAFWLASRLPLPEKQVSPLAVPAAVLTMFTGLFLIVARKKAVTQVVGYLIFENGIYFFGAALFLHHSLVIELGILLDVFVLIFIMGIAVFHINQEFNHIDTDRMNGLSDGSGADGRGAHS